MTRLLNAERDTVRRAILEHVPQIDYDAAASKVATDRAVAALPPEAKKLWRDASTRGLLRTETVYVPWPNEEREGGSWCAFSLPVPGFRDTTEALIRGDLEIQQLVRDKLAQQNLRRHLDRELKINLASVSTHEDFAKRWPELAKYLPDGSGAKVANLPATTQLLDDLKAAGLALDKVPEPA